MTGKSGIFHSLRHFWGDVAEAARDRLRLFANEAEEARIRLMGALLRALLALFCLMMALALSALFLLLAFPQHQLLLAALLALLFFFAALLLWSASRACFTRGKLFSASIAELNEDIRVLRGMDPPASDASKAPPPL
ncbi:MAG: phage holin family protein [Betaproteobacteria bacterium]|nr:phage holin family protein [Betaproteobacteria bacterium]